MPIHVRWNDDTETVVVTQFSGKWTLDELYEGLGKCYAMTNDKPYIVDMIFDMTQSNGIPKNIMSINGYIKRNRPEDVIAIVITQNAFVRTMSEAFIRLLQNEQTILFAKDHDEAMQKLAPIVAART